ncbi:hypothetical protein ACHAXS_000367 [Conticribra weissflogii]
MRHCFFSPCYSWGRESFCEAASLFQAAWSQSKIHGSPSQENSLKFLSESSCLLEVTSSLFLPLPPHWEESHCHLTFWALNEKVIVNLAIQLHDEDIDLEQEDDASRFLGISIICNPQTGFLNMTWKGSINW